MVGRYSIECCEPGIRKGCPYIFFNQMKLEGALRAGGSYSISFISTIIACLHYYKNSAHIARILRGIFSTTIACLHTCHIFGMLRCKMG